MKLILVAVALLCLWSTGSCFRPPKMTLSVRNPKFVTVTEHVYFDVKVFNYYKKDDHLEGRFVVAVFGDLLPMTTLNFVSIAKGYRKGKEFLSYNNTVVHRIIPDFLIQMGDIHMQSGLGGTSIYGNKFRDEAFAISHASSGIVSMANTGRDSNGSQFFVTLRKSRFLDGHHVAFGKVISGMDFLLKVGEIQSHPNEQPVPFILVRNPRVHNLTKKYDLTDVQLETDSEKLDPKLFNIDFSFYKKK